VSLDEDYIVVQNEGKQKQSLPGTTRIGLKNLGAQYRLLAKKNIVVEESGNSFMVKLPLIRSTESQIK
jgi:hypothetical protein